MPPEHRLAVVAHEEGHVLSEHFHYRTVMLIIQQLLRSGVAPLAGLPLQAVLLVLLEWYRCAELSCDRAATLVVDDPLVTCRVLMGIAGGGSAQTLLTSPSSSAPPDVPLGCNPS